MSRTLIANILTVAMALLCGESVATVPQNKDTDVAREITVLDQVISSRKTLSFDSIFSSIASVPPEDVESRYSSLTEEDFAYVADKLDVEVAAIKAVVLIEAGTQMKGFW